MPGCVPTVSFKPRSFHGALRLPGGGVLVAGSGPSELFDPRTGAWRFAGPAFPLFSGDLAPLPDGGALMTGAEPPRAEAYDPDAAVFVPIDRPRLTRYGHRTVALSTGEIALVGGDLDGPPVLEIELFDPRSGRWRVAGTLPDDRRHHTATALRDGSVLIAGSASGSPFGFALRWRPDAPAEPMRAPVEWRSLHDAVALADGRVLIAGGETRDGVISSCWIFDPRASRWEKVGDLSHPRAVLRLALLGDGTVLAVGGRAGGRAEGISAVRAVERFDPATGGWSDAGTLATPRFGHSATALDDDRVLIAGGCFPSPDSRREALNLGSCEIWSATSETPRRGRTAPACPSCGAAPDLGRAWLGRRPRAAAAPGALTLELACASCLAVTRAEWVETADGFDPPTVEASGGAVRRLRDALAAAMESGRLGEEVDALLADPRRLFLLGAPEVWEAARRGMPMDARIVADVDVRPLLADGEAPLPEPLAALGAPALLHRRSAPVPASLRANAVGAAARGGGGGVPFADYEGGQVPALLAGTKLPILGVRGDQLLLGVPEALLPITRDRKTLLAGLDVAHPERASRPPI